MISEICTNKRVVSWYGVRGGDDMALALIILSDGQ